VSRLLSCIPGVMHACVTPRQIFHEMVPSVCLACVPILSCAACRVRVFLISSIVYGQCGWGYCTELDDHLKLLKKFFCMFSRLFFKFKCNATKLHFWRRQRLFNQSIQMCCSASSDSVFPLYYCQEKTDLVSHGFQTKAMSRPHH
jgi:hypothetical protein